MLFLKGIHRGERLGPFEFYIQGYKNHTSYPEQKEFSKSYKENWKYSSKKKIVPSDNAWIGSRWLRLYFWNESTKVAIISSLKFSLIEFQMIFLFSVALISLEAWDVELEWAHFLLLYPLKKTSVICKCTGYFVM